MRKKRGEKDKLSAFVPITWQMLNSGAFKLLPYSAAKALPIFLGKGRTDFHRSGRNSDGFIFSYPEARSRYGFSSKTFMGVIQNLISFGFIDPIEKGGLRGFRQGYNRFKLSERWRQYGKPEFESVSWDSFCNGKD
jgi:hypothetical protein